MAFFKLLTAELLLPASQCLYGATGRFGTGSPLFRAFGSCLHDSLDGRSARRNASTCRGRVQTYIHSTGAVRTHVASLRTVGDRNGLTRALLGYYCLCRLLEGQ